MKKEMDNIEELLKELNIVLEKIREFTLELYKLNWFISSESSRECLKDLVQETKDSLYKILWKYEKVRIAFTNILAAKGKNIEKRTAEIIKNTLGKEKEND